jgi:hypothetical protein
MVVHPRYDHAAVRSFCSNETSCSGRSTGSARRSRLSTTEKIAVLAPIPNASDRITTMLMTGVARNARTLERKSDMLFL